MPKKTIFLSIGGVYPKEEMLPSVRILFDLGYELYASKGTTDFYLRNGIKVIFRHFYILIDLFKIKGLEWPFEEDNGHVSDYCLTTKMAAASKTISDFMANKDIDFIINLPIVNFA